MPATTRKSANANANANADTKNESTSTSLKKTSNGKLASKSDNNDNNSRNNDPKSHGQKNHEFHPWMANVNQCEQHLKTSLRTGLSDKQVETVREIVGFNELAKEEGKSFFAMVMEQFDDSLVRILLLAAVVSAGIEVFKAQEHGEQLGIDSFVEPLVILLILTINAAVGVYQENSAEKSLEALMEMQSEHAKVLRNGKWISDLEARLLVPGDVIEISVGDRVPADCRVAHLKTTTLRAEQMALTGESVSVQKDSEPLKHVADSANIEVQLKTNMVFSGTMISGGSATCIVTGTGMNTEIGKIQDQIKAAAEAKAEEKTPLKQKLDDFSDQLQYLIGLVCLLVWVINFRSFISFNSYSPELWFIPDLRTVSVDFKKAVYYFQIAVALAVAAIPEGLPTVITMCLALGTRKMAKRNCIVRQLPAVETLGCTTIICSDKTGTLTTNQMSVREMIILGSMNEIKRIEIEGSTYNPTDGKAKIGSLSKKDLVVEELARICAVCNDASIELKDGYYKYVGAPTESALLVAVEKLYTSGCLGSVTPEKSSASAIPVCESYRDQCISLATLEFTRERKSMSVIVREKNSKTSNRLLVKGAPENILSRCTKVKLADGKVQDLTSSARKLIELEVEAMNEKAWRTLAFAVREAPDLGEIASYDGTSSHPSHKFLSNTDNFVDVEQKMTWVGVVAMQDPPRSEVKSAIETCTGAGIRVIMITGDNQVTANAIARDVGIFGPSEDVSMKSFIGSEFSKLSMKDKISILWNPENVNGGLVFSRAEPKFKQDLVTLLKKGQGSKETSEIVAMTGDGVNDAPALKMADIGISMGITGTEVAKEASAMVLADDNFSSIVAAVEEGRAIYSNMKAFIRYMISSNVGEVASIFFTAALGFPEGMIPVQLLWINLVTDGPPATALGFNKSEPDVLRKPPRRADDVLVSNWTMFRFLIIGIYVGCATVGIFACWFTHGLGGDRYFMGLDLGRDGHKAVTLEMLMNYGRCDKVTDVFDLPSGKIENFSKTMKFSWTAKGPFHTHEQVITGCDYFEAAGKMKASSLSLSVLVMIEMLNALNALSEDMSILTVTPFSNPYLLLAMSLSFFLHGVILWVPSISPYFSVVPLDMQDILLVFIFSVPVVIIDEVLKFSARIYQMSKNQTKSHSGENSSSKKAQAVATTKKSKKVVGNNKKQE